MEKEAELKEAYDLLFRAHEIVECIAFSKYRELRNIPEDSKRFDQVQFEADILEAGAVKNIESAMDDIADVM